MPRRISLRKVGTVEIDGSRCLPFLWSRFSSEQTARTGGRKLYRELILDNVVSCSVTGPCTHRDIVEQIARQSEWPIPVESLPKELERNALKRGRTIFGFPGNYFDDIACNYAGMRWWMSEKGLEMAAIANPRSNISTFDELAGRPMSEARPRRLNNGRLPPAEYLKIATALDNAQFKPLNHLERQFRKLLAEWNQKHPRQAVHSFCKAVEMSAKHPSLSFLRRGVQKRLNRAESRWEDLKKLSAS